MKYELEDKIQTALSLAAELFNKHGLTDWQTALSTKRTTIADTFFRLKKIEYSKPFVLVSTKEQFEGVTLHEIAHALLGPGFGHGTEFVKMCEKIGALPVYTTRKLDISLHRYNLVCPECGSTLRLLTKRKGVCRECLEIRNKRVDFVVSKNELQVRRW